MASSSRTVYFLAVAFLATVVFQTHQVYTQGQGGACPDLKNQTDCCAPKENLTCLWCAQNVSSPEDVCGADECPPGSQNMCASPTLPPTTSGPTPQPTENCTSYTDHDSCCKSNCSFCQAAGATEGVCSSQCVEGSNDTCSAEPTTPPPTTLSPAPPACDTLNVTTCCETSGRCSLCAPKDGSDERVCKDNGTCSDTEVDSCTESPTVAPPTNSTGNPPTPTAAPSGGGGGGQHFDAASFIGGIILCGGIFAIVFFGCKFYKARKDQNYHTL